MTDDEQGMQPPEGEPKQDLTARQERRVSMSRVQAFSDQILENEGLRQHLSDDQARAMINWAIERLELMAEDSAEWGDDSAERLLDTLTNGLSNVIGEVNALMGPPTLEGVDGESAVSAELQQVAEQFSHLEQDQLFQKLFTAVSRQDGTITEESGE